ncbi:hypothetical protein TNCT_596011 [Trichonephila clavata]|uniref:Protein kinase domain-containing protein n=1 Tax=Trichonephila clavata TaxID=2740835 RepID=A0A8X6FFB6_TRICU|nr:hypothetical protein TNCT_596011 [Trichonephila clavata]
MDGRDWRTTRLFFFCSAMDLARLPRPSLFSCSSAESDQLGPRKRFIIQRFAGLWNARHHVWSDVSEEAKSFIHELLQTDPSMRLSANAALQHDWFTTPKLTYSPPRNNDRHKSDRRSLRSSRSVGSSRSGGSVQSLRVSGHRRVQIHHLEALSSDPEVAAMM